jgi:hypothetical protein
MTTIDFRTMPANVPSLCIPRVFPNIDERRIRAIFDSLNMGEIERVDIMKKKTDKNENFNRVFIHWKCWNDSNNSNQARERLLNGKEIKIIYDDPWFWKISAYREQQKVYRPPATINNVPRLQFDSDEEKPNTRRAYQRDDRNKSFYQRDDRNKNSVKNHEVKHYAPTTPNSSPPRPERLDEVTTYDADKATNSVILDYGNIPFPKKLTFKNKKPIVLDDEEEVKK